MGLTHNQTTTAAVLGTGLVIGAVAAGYYQYRKRVAEAYWNAPFVSVGKVNRLNLFPIKSGKPIQTEWLDCTDRGVAYGENKDRHFLVVDAKTDHRFLTARTYPKLVLIAANVENNVLTVTVPGEPGVSVDLGDVVKRNDVRRGILHDKLTHDVGKLIENFLQVTGKREIRLLYSSDELPSERDYDALGEFWHNPVPKHRGKPAYQDLCEYLLCTESSVDDLNSKLAQLDDDKATVSMLNFRPNIGVDGPPPYDEDKWLNVRIGEVEFSCFKPCTRCVLTTVDPESGTFLKNLQPLRLLREFRLAPEGRLRNLYGQSPIFGVNMFIVTPGRIRIGDEVQVQYKPSPY
uniref:MOSC domain-containing protein n=1 Tax=Panagrellus redivivus TaxID=6233 RepID=A0A7E4ZQV2_PANRE